MARTSKKEQESNDTPAKMPAKMYSAGIYARLSVDGSERKKESVETQIEIAKDFIRRQKDMVLFDCYTDIGKTGTNFEREGFERMMRDVRMRRIDCIIVKDLSRFGRNHIETGNYIEKLFPCWGVRFIAITDHFDSMNLSGEQEAWSVNLKNLVNEMYAKDIAVKVKSSRKEQWEQGSYTGGVPPYGYRAEWIEGKKCLFIEENTAEIVKKIYDLFLSGKNRKEIVRWLYENRVARPCQYHITGNIFCQEGEALQQWSQSTVKMILTNPVYMGCLVQGKTCGKRDRMRERQDLTSEDWSVREHTHEAIIGEDLFFKAAAKFERSAVYCSKSGYSKMVPAKEDIFAELLFCGNCGSKMKRIGAIKQVDTSDRVRIYSYHCPRTDRIDTYQCITQNISFRTLHRIVKEAIRQEVSLSAMHPQELAESKQREAEQIQEEGKKQLFAVEKRIKNVKKRGSEQYLRYRMGELSEESFRREKEDNDKIIALLKKKRSVIAEKQKDRELATVQKNQFLLALIKGDEKTELTAEAVRTLISRIEVYPDRRVKVIFAFKRKDMPFGKERI